MTGLVTDGDSLTFGTGSTGGQNWPVQTQGLNSDVKIHNIAVAGQTMATILANAPTNVDNAFYKSGRFIVNVWAGTNDLYAGGSAATLLTNTQSYGNGRHTANPNVKIIVINVLPSSAAGIAPGAEAARITFNSSTRTDFNVATAFTNIYLPAGGTTYGDVMIDVGADSLIGLPGSQNDLTYYNADKNHLNNTGYAIIAAYVNQALSLLK